MHVSYTYVYGGRIFMLQCMYGGQKTDCSTQFSHSYGIELRSWGLAASTFIHRAISPALSQHTDFVSFNSRPSSGVVRSYGDSIFNFLRSLHMGFQNCYASLHSYRLLPALGTAVFSAVLRAWAFLNFVNMLSVNGICMQF